MLLDKSRAAVFSFVTFLICSFVVSVASANSDPTIKIRLKKGLRSCNVKSESCCFIHDLKISKKPDHPSEKNFHIEVEGNSLIINDRWRSSSVKLAPKTPASVIYLDGKPYRGAIVINAKNNRFSVGNELSVDKYLYGVLPKEVAASWPKEALKAQAIVSRTYTLQNLGRHKKDGFDLCDEVHCQVYGGVDAEDGRTTTAVDETHGQVLTYKGKLADTFFHGCCGGHTENPEFVWGFKAPKYLRGRSVRFAHSCKRNIWTNSISKNTISRKLANKGYDVGAVKRIRMSGRNRSGRTINLKITGKKRSITISAAKFRLIVGAGIVKSTMLRKIANRRDKIEFSGAGWGHGVGLCQISSKEMAKKGYKYKKIVTFFYPGTKLVKWR